jgi:hypothetical protein
MKADAGNKTKVRIAILLVIAAILSVTWSLMSHEASRSEAVPVAASGTKGSAETAGESLDPRLRLDLLANSEDVIYEGKGKNIFRAAPEVADLPAVKVPPLLAQQEEARRNANAVPPPPPINLRFFGISDAKGEKPKAFLSQGEDVWIAREGDVVDRHYKIVRISPNSVEVEDLLNNNRQPVPLTKE